MCSTSRMSAYFTDTGMCRLADTPANQSDANGVGTCAKPCQEERQLDAMMEIERLKAFVEHIRCRALYQESNMYPHPRNPAARLFFISSALFCSFFHPLGES